MNRFFTVDEINPKLILLQERYDKIIDEFHSNFESLVWTNWNGDNDYKQITESPYKGWKVSALMVGSENISDRDIFSKELEKSYNQKVYFDSHNQVFLFENSKYLPTLIETLLECDIKKRVGLSVVFPDKEISWHIVPDPETAEYAIIRGMWGLEIKQEKDRDCFLCLGDEVNYQKKSFKNNEFMFFWGRTKHMVLNTLQTARYVVLFDQDVSKQYLLNLGN